MPELVEERRKLVKHLLDTLDLAAELARQIDDSRLSAHILVELEGAQIGG